MTISEYHALYSSTITNDNWTVNNKVGMVFVEEPIKYYYSRLGLVTAVMKGIRDFHNVSYNTL